MSPSVFLAGLATIIIWGMSPVATKFAVLGFAPLTMAAARTLIGALAALPLIYLLRLPLPEDWPRRRLLMASGAGGFILFPLLFTLGMSLTSGIHGAMILAFLPVTTGAIAHFWDRKWPDLFWWLGCALALAGEFVLIHSRTVTGANGGEILGDLYVWASLSFASLGYVAGARLTRSGYKAQAVTYWGIILASLALLGFTPWLFSNINWQAIPLTSWLGLIYMGPPVSVLGYVLWYFALAKGGIEKVGLFQFFQPLVGVMAAALLLQEALSPWLYLAVLMILSGVFVATRGRNLFQTFERRAQ